MTQEHPERPPSSPVFCDDCRTAVRLERMDHGVILRCACGNSRNVTIDRSLPIAWEQGTGRP